MKYFRPKYLIYLTLTLSTFLITTPEVLATTFVSGPLTRDTRWTQAGSPYVVGEGFVVPQNIRLTIDPGVIVKIDPTISTPPLIFGKIKALGTSQKPIYFTSLRDDSVGGDTNMDGNLTSPSIVDWTISFGDPESVSVDSSFNFTNFRYMFVSFIMNRLVTLSNGNLTDGTYGFFLDTKGHINIDKLSVARLEGFALVADNHSQIQANRLVINRADSLFEGVYVQGESTLKLTNSTIFNDPIGRFSLVVSDSDVTISDSAFRDGGGGGILASNNLDLTRPSNLNIQQTVFKNLGNDGVVLFDKSNLEGKNLEFFNLQASGVTLINSFADLEQVKISQGTGGSGIELFGNTTLPYTSKLKARGLLIEKYDQPGISSFDSQAVIDYSLIRDNSLGIRVFTGGRSDPNQERFEITKSAITNNTEGGITAVSVIPSPEYDVKAEYNWWGHTSGPFHPTLNPDGQGNSVSDHVDFIPWIGFNRSARNIQGDWDLKALVENNVQQLRVASPANLESNNKDQRLKDLTERAQKSQKQRDEIINQLKKKQLGG